MIDIQLLKLEALIFHNTIDRCDKEASTVITNEFPIGNCLFASLLLAFHYRKLWGVVDIVAFYGLSENSVSHVWLEIEGYAIDITGSQYNLLYDYELNPDVIERRPYPCVHFEKISESYLYQLFWCSQELVLNNDFSEFRNNFVEKLEYSYDLIRNDLDISRREINKMAIITNSEIKQILMEE